MREELYAYAIMYAMGFDTGDRFTALLNEMTLNDEEGMLELQYMSLKDAVTHAMFMIETSDFDQEIFGKKLMQLCREMLDKKPLSSASHRIFSNKMRRLWEHLPEKLQYEDPFVELCGADDCIGIVPDANRRDWFRWVFDYYNRRKG